jgi:hypothetical protein
MLSRTSSSHRIANAGGSVRNTPDPHQAAVIVMAVAARVRAGRGPNNSQLSDMDIGLMQNVLSDREKMAELRRYVQGALDHARDTPTRAGQTRIPETETSAETPVATAVVQPPLRSLVREASRTYNEIVLAWKTNDKRAAAHLIANWLTIDLRKIALRVISEYRVPAKYQDLAAIIFDACWNFDSRSRLDNFERLARPIAEFLQVCVSWERLSDNESRNFIILPQIKVDADQLKRITAAVVHCERLLLAPQSGDTHPFVSDMDRVVYNPVVISGNLMRGALAFYVPTNDSLFIQKQSQIKDMGAVGLLEHALLHELGHRFWQKVATPMQQASWAMYDQDCHRRRKTGFIPQLGTVFLDPDRYWAEEAKLTLTAQQRLFWECRKEGSHGTVLLPADAVITLALFPSMYAASDVQEHFCEAFALYLQGNLPTHQADHFKVIWQRVSSGEVDENA